MVDKNDPHSQYVWTTAGNNFFVFSIRPGNEMARLATLFLCLYLFKFLFQYFLYLFLAFVFSVVVFSIRPDNEIDSSLTSFTFPQNWLHLLLFYRKTKTKRDLEWFHFYKKSPHNKNSQNIIWESKFFRPTISFMKMNMQK